MNFVRMMNRVKRVMIASVVCIVSVYSTRGQQLPQYTLFQFNPYLFNPAVAGTEDFVHLQASYRSQWSGFRGAPETEYFSVHSPINKETIGYGTHKKFLTERWHSAGGVFIHDKTGPIIQTSVYGTFSYNMPLSTNGLRVSIGGNAGLKGFSYNPEGYLINIANPNDPILQTAFTSYKPDVSFGFWLYNHKYFMGASAYHLLDTNSKDVELWTNRASFDRGQLVRHFFFMAGYKVVFQKDFFVVPSILIKELAPLNPSVEVNIKTVYKSNYWLGLSYRNKESLSLSAGLLIGKSLEFSYAYDAIVSSLRPATFGSNEVLIGYRWNLKPKTICPDKFW